MTDLTIKKQAVNPAGLHAELAAALGDAFYGISLSGETVTVHLVDMSNGTPGETSGGAPDAATQAQIAALVEAHQADKLTPGQEAAKARDALPFFQLDPAALATEAEKMDAAIFRKEMGRAFAYLRDLVRGA